MTSRLLRASLGSPDYDEIRDTLRRDSSVIVASARGLSARAAVLPLLRRDAIGNLRQAIRLDVSMNTERRLLTALISVHGNVVDTVEVTPGTGALLLVPEVTEPTAGRLELRDGSAEVATGTVTITPQRKWTVFVVHHSHLDIGYTDPQGAVLRYHQEYLDSALSLARATDSWPDDARFRWTVESALPALRWLAARPTAAVREFTDRVAEGRIEVTALPFQLHTEACSTEELDRQLRFAGQLRDRFGMTIRSAMHTDVPGAVVGLIDALTRAGVRYLSAAHNWAGRSVPYLVGGETLTRPFRWRAPSGNELLTWFTDTPHGMAYMEGNTVGLADGYDLALDMLPRYLDALARRPYPYGQEAFGWNGIPADATIARAPYPFDAVHLRLQGAHADNAGPSIIPADIVRRWSESWTYPRLRMAVNSDFFAHVEQCYGDRLAVHEGDWTDWWADGMGSGARPLGYVRRAQATLRTAETMHALASDESADAAVAEAYDKIALFNEHTWGAADPWEDAESGRDSGGIQWTLKSAIGYQAYDAAADLEQSGRRRLGATFARSPDAAASYVVINPGPVGRTDIAEVFLPRDVLPLDVPVTLTDARTGRELGHHETVVHPDDWPTRPIGRRLAVVVPDVPSLGYVRLDMVRGTGDIAASADGGGAVGAVGAVENEYYRVSFDAEAGGISSVFDKTAGRELVNDSAAARFGQYIYDRYATAPHFNHLSGHIAAHGSPLLGGRYVGESAVITRARRTPAGERLVVSMTARGTDLLRTTIDLYPGVPRVDLTFRLVKQNTPAKESVFFAFPFAAGAPPAAWELTGGVGGASVPRVPGSATHMIPIRHWAGFSDPELTIAWATLEAPLVQLGTIHVPYAPFPPTLDAEPGTIYSWALNNIWDTNFPSAQQGEMMFRYAVSSAAGVPARRLGAATAAGLTDPFTAIPATGTGTASAPSGVFASVDHPDVHLTSAGRSAGELRLRVRSLAPEPVSATVTVFGEPIRVAVPACGTAEVTLSAGQRNDR
ncbi:MAG: hypothetical protein JO345_19815 [Streptosporangiaceae bacterium]|nr:hypothetical protein [Streptosporangiaceae bacterium]